jgi:hypothetical protein
MKKTMEIMPFMVKKAAFILVRLPGDTMRCPWRSSAATMRTPTQARMPNAKR